VLARIHVYSHYRHTLPLSIQGVSEEGAGWAPVVRGIDRGAVGPIAVGNSFGVGQGRNFRRDGRVGRRAKLGAASRLARGALTEERGGAPHGAPYKARS